jgi:hypothetical protein
MRTNLLTQLRRKANEWVQLQQQGRTFKVVCLADGERLTIAAGIISPAIVNAIQNAHRLLIAQWVEQLRKGNDTEIKGNFQKFPYSKTRDYEN